MGQQALLLIIFTAAYTKQELWDKVCPKPLSEVGIDPYFGDMIAHTMHSLTVEDIRYYFKKDADVDNGIPTVNFDLTPNVTRVLPKAPLSGYDLSFTTIALRHTDQVLSKMDNENWGIAGYSVLEELVHAHHMAELWERSRPHYKYFEKSPPSPKVCSCLRRINENGVRAELELLALRIKFPGLLSGDPDLPYGINADASTASKKYIQQLRPGTQDYTFTFALRRSKDDDPRDEWKAEYHKKLMNFDFHGDEQDVVDRARKELHLDNEGKIDPLVNEGRWNIWKEGLLVREELVDRKFGMFMYCMLNK